MGLFPFSLLAHLQIFILCFHLRRKQSSASTVILPWLTIYQFFVNRQFRWQWLPLHFHSLRIGMLPTSLQRDMRAHTTHIGFRGQLWAKVHCVLVRKSYGDSAPSHQPDCQLTRHHLSVKASQLNTQQHGWANHHNGCATLPLPLQRNDRRIGRKLSRYEVRATAKRSYYSWSE